MLNEINIENLIINSKKKLRNLSNDFRKNFLNIEQFIKQEVKYIEQLKDKNKKIIPEINPPMWAPYAILLSEEPRSKLKNWITFLLVCWTILIQKKRCFNKENSVIIELIKCLKFNPS